MTRPGVLLIGAGGHARACIDVIEQEGRYVVAGLVGTPSEVGTRILDYPVLGADTDLEVLLRDGLAALVTVGQIKTPEVRSRLFDHIIAQGAHVVTVISPRAYVSRHAEIGDGTIVMHGAIVNAGAVVGRNCIINSQALVEHDAVVGDHCHVATGARINSGVRLGRGSFLGSGATVRQLLSIGERCVIGMGQRVLTDCPAGSQLPPRRTSA